MEKVLNYGDVMKISQELSKLNFHDYGLTIETKIHSRELFDKVNEEFFYRSNRDNPDTKPEECDVVTLHVNGINFRYVLDESQDS